MAKPNPKRIIITHPWTSKTKGDVAVLFGVLEMTKAAFPDAEIFVLQEIGAWHPGHSFEAARDLYKVKELPDFTPLRVYIGEWLVEDARHPPRPARINKLVRAAIELENITAWLATKLLKKSARRLFVGNMRRYLDALAQTDLVLSTGGDYFHSGDTLYADLQQFLPTVIPWLLAQAARVPLALIGHSVWGLNGPISRPITRSLLNYSLLFTCREKTSADYLLRTGLLSSPPPVIPCPSFACPRKPLEHGQTLLEQFGLHDLRPLIGLTVRCWPDPALTQRYLTAIVEMAKYMNSRYDMHFVILPQNIPPGDLQTNDQAVNPWLLDIAEAHGIRDIFHVLSADLLPQDLIPLYGALDAFIGMRLHSCIFAARGHCPPLAIAYSPHKFEGIMKMMGLENMVLEMPTLEPDKLIAAVENLWQNRQDIRQKLSSIIPHIEAQAWENKRLLERAVAGE